MFKRKQSADDFYISQLLDNGFANAESDFLVKLAQYFQKKPELVNLNNETGTTLLIQAAISKNLPVLVFLLNQQLLDPNKFDNTGFAALHWAVYGNWQEGIEQLLALTATDPHLKTNNLKHESALDLAKSLKYTPIVNTIEQYIQDRLSKSSAQKNSLK